MPVEREVLKYRKWGRPFYPLRFLNLLPLSHMFGQAMATFIPPMLPGVVIFMRGYNPAEIVSQIKRRRVSVLVCVPKILDVLREHARRAAPEAAPPPPPGLPAAPARVREAAANVPAAKAAGPRQHIVRRWWRYRRLHRIFGLKFWAFIVGAAPLDTELEAFWGELGFVVIQGYGLTETAPIVSLNHPFGTTRGSVGKAMAGVDVKIAPDGEILVRGENVTTGYFNAAEETARAFEGGWFHTGDIGEIGEGGQLFIRGRKKELIITPEGLNVFPEDVERVLIRTAGVRDAAVVGVPGTAGSRDERVHAVLLLDPGIDPDAVVRAANAALADHQKIRRAIVWPEPELPRTEGTRKLKRAMLREWVQSGAAPRPAPGGRRSTGRAHREAGGPGGRLAADDDRRAGVELARARRADGGDGRRIPDAHRRGRLLASAGSRRTTGGRRPGRDAATTAPMSEPVDFPTWNRSWPARTIRRLSLPTWILPLARVFAHIHVEGREQLRAIDAPVIFAANHQSHMDTPVLMAALPARLRYRLAPAMAKEFFSAHFFPEKHGRKAWLANSLNYYLAALFFNAFPLPQREAGARQTLRYIGEVLAQGFSVLIFPEGRRTETGEIDRFRPGIGMIGSRLGAPVVPVRIEGLDKVLHHTWRMARPGRVRVAFGAPIQLVGDDYEALAKRVEEAVRAL